MSTKLLVYPESEKSGESGNRQEKVPGTEDTKVSVRKIPGWVGKSLTRKRV